MSASGLQGLVLQAELLASNTSAGNSATDADHKAFNATPLPCVSLALCTGHTATIEQCLQRLILGGIQVKVIVQAATADEMVQQ
jgi:hypothetical protein